ncbi:MAG: DUF58 domain-containing protein [Gemmatimonadetes bacterium]|nr:DUF58 domain-containing protein [Gemmatimonadota bacterium]
MIRWLPAWLTGREAGPPAAESPASESGKGVPREILRQVRQIELRTRGLVDAIFGGEYHSVFRGQGMEFAEVREYQSGDDVRHIDWNVTARMGHPYVKKHVEERELTVLLAVDLSGSEQFATRGRFKAEAAAEVAAVLALSAVRNNDRVGLILFTDRIEHVVPPAKGRKHVLRLIRDVLAFEPEGSGTDITGALDFAARLLPHKSIVFLLSDFIEGRVAAASADATERFEKTFRVVARRHDVVAVRIEDAGESALPEVGILAVVDPETAEELVIDTGDENFRTTFARLAALEQAGMRRLFRRLGVDEIVIRTDAPLVKPLLSFFRRRERMLRR